MGVKDHVEVAIKSVCLAIAHKALSLVEANDEDAPTEDAPREDVEFYATHATPEPAPPNINGAASSSDADHSLWVAEQEMLRRVRPGSPLIDPDYDAMISDIVSPMDIS